MKGNGAATRLNEQDIPVMRPLYGYPNMTGESGKMTAQSVAEQEATNATFSDHRPLGIDLPLMYPSWIRNIQSFCENVKHLYPFQSGVKFRKVPLQIIGKCPKNAQGIKRSISSTWANIRRWSTYFHRRRNRQLHLGVLVVRVLHQLLRDASALPSKRSTETHFDPHHT